MLLVRTGGIFGVIVSLIVAGIFLFVVRPAINDTTDRAFDTADRIIDNTNQQIEDTQRQVHEATGDLGIEGDYLAAENFSAIVGDLKAELGADAEILDFTANPMGGNVKYRTGDRAAGFQFGTGFDGLQPVKVTLVGSGKLADNVFPIAEAARRRRRQAHRRRREAGRRGLRDPEHDARHDPGHRRDQVDGHRRGRRPPAGLPGRRRRVGPQEDLLDRQGIAPRMGIPTRRPATNGRAARHR